MEILEAVTIGVICTIVGFILGMKYQKSAERNVGSFVVNHIDPEIHGGVYTVFDVDPQLFRDGERVFLDVITADTHKQSQQNQGR